MFKQSDIHNILKGLNSDIYLFLFVLHIQTFEHKSVSKPESFCLHAVKITVLH